MLIIFILVCSFLLIFWISIEFSYALYFGHDIPIVAPIQNLSLSPKQITATETGDVYVVWVDKNNTYFTSSHDSGNKFAPEVLLSDSNKSSSTPQLAATEKGDVYVVWVDKNSTTGDTDITFRNSNDSGRSFDDTKKLTGNKPVSSFPQLAATEKGDVYVVWVDKNNKTGDTDITFRNSNDSGRSFDDTKKLTGNKPVSSFPQLSATEKGDVYVVWVDKNSTTGDTDITFRNSNDSGRSFDDTKNLRRSGTLFSSFPQLAATEKGDVYVVWVDKNNKTGDTDITFRNSNDSGRSFDDTKNLRRSGTLFSSFPQLAATEKGDVYVVWVDKNSTTGDSDITFRSSSDRGKDFERALNLNKGEKKLSNSSFPQVDTTQKDTVYVVWVDNEIQFREILVKDAVVGNPIALNNRSTSLVSPQITATKNGNLFALWIDKDNMTDTSLHFKRISENYFDRNS